MTNKIANRLSNIAKDLTDGAKDKTIAEEKFNLHLKYLAGIGILIFDRWRWISFNISKSSIQHYTDKYDVLEEVIFEIIPECPEHEQEFMKRLNYINSLINRMIIKDVDGTPTHLKTELAIECKTEMDKLRVDLLKIINEKGWLKFKTVDPRNAITEID